MLPPIPIEYGVNLGTNLGRRIRIMGRQLHIVRMRGIDFFIRERQAPSPAG